MQSEYYGKAVSELCSWMLRTKALEPKYLVPGRCYPLGASIVPPIIGYSVSPTYSTRWVT